ncbi:MULTISPECIES: alpha/beta hydrolase family protein [Pseudoalteromonas]|uniref:S9 family peptidase n=1 Tax=Pseudoalteromonas lipolytica TaxID=570156 RepID=A0AAD0S2G0_9GAMM|nr:MULTISPECIES: S9 family peptidase [Pseudoalteromonas]AXV64916.1 S9 family peptidase [Pseudoalteromonas donghaensis]QLJ09420.1 S9 family peptidase [Pseudoalteromonas sp. JSTW]QMW15623.1 S9 family peptidase [Pseudoalteromonas sp. MT33b]
MRYIKSLGLLLLLFSQMTFAKNTLEDFFNSKDYQQVKISPNGKYFSITFQDETQVKLVILDRKTKKVLSSYGFGEYQKIANVIWVNDERFIMSVKKTVGYLDTKGGSPYFIASNFDGSNRRELLASQTSFYNILSILPDDKENILVTKQHYADDFAVKVHKVNVYNGRSSYQADQPKEDVFGMVADVSGQPRIAFSYVEKEEHEMGKGELNMFYKKTPNSDWETFNLGILNYNPGDNLSIIGMNKSGNLAYFTNDSTTKNIAVFSFNLETNELKKLIEDADVDISTPIYGFSGEVVGVTYDPNYPAYHYFSDAGDNDVLKRLSDSFHAYRLRFTSHAKEQKLSVFEVSSDKSPTEFYLYDITSKKASFVASMNEKINKKELATVEPFKISARDGVVLHGYITIPNNKKEPYSAVVMLHGGPHGVRDFWGFNAEAQYLASIGYAVLQVNFRGSGGYGSSFLKSGYKNWGTKMQDDVTDATHWAIKQKIIDKNNICIYGGSYGGYAALMGAVREPDLYKCAIGYVGVYSIPEMFSSGDIPTRDSGVKFLNTVHGMDVEDQKSRSPAYNVDKIKAKLFIAHGSDDIRVPMEQYEALTSALDRINYPYKSMVRNEGHGYHKPKNRTDFYNAMTKFLDENLK